MKCKIGARPGFCMSEHADVKVEPKDVQVLSKSYAAYPGENLIDGDRKGMLEIIRTTQLGDEHICHKSGEKCYDAGYNQAPYNFIARIKRGDFKGPPGIGAEVIDPNSQQCQMLKHMPMDMITLPLEQLKENWQLEQLSHAKRHVLWIAMDGIGHHCLIERLAGCQGWRFYQSFIHTRNEG